MLERRWRARAWTRLFGATLASVASVAGATSPPIGRLPTKAELQAAHRSADELDIVSVMERDCPFQAAVSRAIALRLAQSYSECDFTPNFSTCVDVLQAEVADRLKVEMVQNARQDIDGHVTQTLWEIYKDQQTLEDMARFFAQPSGRRLAARYVKSDNDLADSVGYVLLFRLQPQWAAIKTTTRIDYANLRRDTFVPVHYCLR